jgi:hypothetical protein
MPIALHPLPRRIRRTHENCPLGVPVCLHVPPDAEAAVSTALLEILEPLFPGIDTGGDADPEILPLRLALFEGAVEEIPAQVASQAYRMAVGPGGIEIAAGSPAGWQWAVRQLPGLREGEALTGIELLDWPSFCVRRVELDWPAESLRAVSFETLFHLLALGRVNELGLAGLVSELSEPIRESAERHGLRLVSIGGEPAFRLLDGAALFPRYSERLPALQEAALKAEAEGLSEFVVSLGEIDGQTALESLAFGLLFAGDCAWNPRKADLKAFRRTYAMRRFGLDSRAPTLVIDTLDEGSTLLGPAPAIGCGDPFDPASTAGIARPDEQATGLERLGAAAMAAMGPLQPDSEERAFALQGLQWSVQRLRRAGSLLGTAEKVRELYRAAYGSAASPKAVSDRLLRAVDLMEGEARAWDALRGEWHALWRREREEPYDPETETALRVPGEVLLARAARLKDLRSQYIQTGSLPSPAKEGLERTTARLTTGLVPGRLPPQPSPAWWPEGGAARVRLEVECPEAAAGIPWAVQADFRALAGETGAFNVRSARLTPITESDEAGPEQPCQLMRGGFAFVPEAGPRSYFLYLDPETVGDSGFREVRAGQSRRGVWLENRWMRVSLAPATGFINGWRLLDLDRELLPEEAETEATREVWRLRLIETGPLLARVRCEHPDGRIRQFDLAAGQHWIDFSVNSPGEEVVLPLSEGLWQELPEYKLQLASGAAAAESKLKLVHPLRGYPRQEAVTWAEIHDADGLTLGLVLPESPAGVTLAVDRLRVDTLLSGHCLLFAGTEPGSTLERLMEAWQRPPQVRLGIFEHRRVREF